MPADFVAPKSAPPASGSVMPDVSVCSGWLTLPITPDNWEAGNAPGWTALATALSLRNQSI